MFTLPSGIISIITALFAFGYGIYRLTLYLSDKVEAVQAVGIGSLGGFHFEWFYFNTGTVLLLSILLYTMVIISILIGRSMSQRRAIISLDFMYFIVIYSIVAPFWVCKAVYNTAFTKAPRWR